MKSRTSIGLVILGVVTGAVLDGGARAEDCGPGSEKEYVVWHFDTAASVAKEAGLIEPELTAIGKELLGGDLKGVPVPSLALVACTAKPSFLDTLVKRRPEGLQEFRDSHIVVAVTASGLNVEYHIVPYLTERRLAPKLVAEDACKPPQSAATADEYRTRIQAYLYAALALREIWRLETHRDPDPCGARRAEFFVKHALSKLDEIQARVGALDAPTDALQLYLLERRLKLDGMIDEIGSAANRCGMPRESPKLPKVASAGATSSR